MAKSNAQCEQSSAAVVQSNPTTPTDAHHQSESLHDCHHSSSEQPQKTKLGKQSKCQVNNPFIHLYGP